GVSPKKGGTTNLDLPVFATVREAAQSVRPDASLVHVPASFAAGAIEEAIEAEIPLIVAIAEHIPVHYMLRVHEILRTQSKSRLVGPNTPGILAPGKCRIGILMRSSFLTSFTTAAQRQFGWPPSLACTFPSIA
ncbi:hypothetical protein ACHAQC_011982, partial [Fusarium culmorum]